MDSEIGELTRSQNMPMERWASTLLSFTRKGFGGSIPPAPYN